MTNKGTIMMASVITNFMTGLNIMYCLDRPEVGLWRVPILAVALVAFDVACGYLFKTTINN